MSLPAIGSITPAEVRGGEVAADAPPKPEGVDFGRTLGDALARASQGERAAAEAAERFAAGDPGTGIHEVIIAAEKASISVRYAVTLKNKALEAYRELMNTQV
jgi:flagellar hook-basal body complex protein FliE